MSEKTHHAAVCSLMGLLVLGLFVLGLFIAWMFYHELGFANTPQSVQVFINQTGEKVNIADKYISQQPAGPGIEHAREYLQLARIALKLATEKLYVGELERSHSFVRQAERNIAVAYKCIETQKLLTKDN